MPNADAPAPVPTAADKIVDSLNGKDKNSDFSHVMFEIGEAQRRDSAGFGDVMNAVNAKVDWKQYGLASDADLLGLSSDGKALFKDGNTVQTRDIVHLGLEKTDALTTSTQTWGSREFQTSNDRSAEYTVKGKDTVWSVAKDVLSQQLKDRGEDRKPTNKEIQQTIADIAKLNNMSSADVIHPGDKIKIPQGMAEAAMMPEMKMASIAPATSFGEVNTDVVQGDMTGLNAKFDLGDNTFNAMASAGFPNTDSDWIDTSYDHGSPDGQQPSDGIKVERTREDGMTKTVYSGKLDDYDDNATFRHYETTDRQGRITSRTATYDGSGVGMEFDKGAQGTEYISYVQQIATTLNPVSGNYESVITTGTGAKYRSTTDANGKVVDWKQL